VLALLGCAAPEAAQPGAAQPDAGQPSDGGPVPDCSPACTAPLTTCVAHACVCTPLAHDGGDGSCVALNACADGFGQGGGDSTCRPVAEVCPPVACGVARAWMPGRCSYSPLPDGAACAGHSGDQCISQFECRTGQCVGLQNGCGARRPLVLVHGINGSSADFKVMKARFLADGWPESWIYLFDAADPKWGCNVDNAAAIRALVERARAETCQPRVDIVAHSMGSLSSRYFLKDLQGAGLVNTYVTLGGPHHGLSAPCFAPGALGVCVWKELCESGDFIKELNTAPVIVGHGPWVSIYGTADTTIPNASSQLAGAENIAMPGVEHYGPKGLNEDAATYAQVLRVLGYPCW
jgi:triacylglycerol lipase